MKVGRQNTKCGITEASLSLTTCNFGALVCVSGSGGGGSEKVIFGFAWSFDPTLHVSLQFRRLRLKNFGLKLTLLAIWVYNWCSREMKNKHTGTLNTSINCCITRNQHYKTAKFPTPGHNDSSGFEPEKREMPEYGVSPSSLLTFAFCMPYADRLL